MPFRQIPEIPFIRFILQSCHFHRNSALHQVADISHCLASTNNNYIYWISRSSASKATNAAVTLDGVFESTESPSRIFSEYPDVFVRVHSMHLVNPIYVQSVRRFALLLQDGTELPIPEKKYTAVKREIAERLGISKLPKTKSQEA